MITLHSIIYGNSNSMTDLADESIDLVVTSPPYPMIEMWDGIFAAQDSAIDAALNGTDGQTAYELMHQQLDKVWDELYRVLKTGGIACINIGDATRTIDGHFALYTNHSRILTYMQQLGFSALPAILWRKQTNAPNKFMGSGMMPPGAYVTLEHEYVLILRKGNKREFKNDNGKKNRRESSFFWEERNLWFSDVWMDLKGTTQILHDSKTRDRSGAFPFELPYRLITMFSVKGDTVLDPFFGTGTTMYAAMATGRNSNGYEIDRQLRKLVSTDLNEIASIANLRINERLEKHVAFAKQRYEEGGSLKHVNKHYHFPVMTAQETDLIINELESIAQTVESNFKVTYSELPQARYVGNWENHVPSAGTVGKKDPKQRELF